MLWFKFIFGLKFFKPVLFLIPFVSDYDNECKTMKNKNQPGLKNFKPKINLNHNIYKLLLRREHFLFNTVFCYFTFCYMYRR